MLLSRCHGQLVKMSTFYKALSAKLNFHFPHMVFVLHTVEALTIPLTVI